MDFSLTLTLQNLSPEALVLGLAHGLHSWQNFAPDHGLFFAQAIEKVDVLGDFQKAWNNFIQSGQVWALIIGFVLGWMFRNFTGG